MRPINLAHWHKSLCIGVNGQGKSVLFRYLVKAYLESGCRVLFYDSEKELTQKIPKRLGIEPETYLTYLKTNYPNLGVYEPKHSSKTQRIEEFDRVCGRAFETGKIILATESIEFYAPSKKPLGENLEKIIHWGRNEDVGMISTLRRPANANSDITSLLNNAFLFHVYSYNDKKWLKAFLSKEVVDSLDQLPKYHFYHWTQDGVVKHDPIKEEAAQL